MRTKLRHICDLVCGDINSGKAAVKHSFFRLGWLGWKRKMRKMDVTIFKFVFRWPSFYVFCLF